MRLALRPDLTLAALRAIARKHPAHKGPHRTLQLTADADGLTIETNLSSAFVPAQVAVAGSCLLPAQQFARLLRTFPARKPVSLEIVDAQHVRLGTLVMPTAGLL